jgi:hypothetical protein
MRDEKITYREYQGRMHSNLLKLIFGLIKDEEYRKIVISKIEEHKYISRRKDDPKPHPRSGKRFLSQVPNPTRGAEELARYILEVMEPNYNADTSNRMKEYLLKTLEEVF